MRRDTNGYSTASGVSSQTGGSGTTPPAGPASWLHRLTHAAEERDIEFGSLSWPLRLAVVITISGALLAGLFILTQNVPQPHIGVFTGSGLPDARMPIGVFACGLALWVIAWTFGLTGALHGHWSMRLLVLAAFLYPISQSFAPDIHVAIYLAPIVVLLLWAAVVSVIQWRAAHTKCTMWRWLPAITCAVVAATLTAYYVAFYLFVRATASMTTEFADLLTNQVQALSFVLLPALFLAGTDIAEWGVTTSRQASALLGRLRFSWVLPVATMLLAGGVLVVTLWQRGDFTPLDLVSIYDMLEIVLIAAVCVVLAVVITRIGRLRVWTVRAIPPWSFVLAAVVTMAGLAGPVVIGDIYISTHATAPVVAQYDVYRHTANNLPFSVAYPDGWQTFSSEPTSEDDLTAVDLVSQVNQHTYEFTIVVVPAADRESSDLLSATEIVQGLCDCTPALTSAPAHGPWQERRTSGTEQFTKQSKPVPQNGFAWWQAREGNLWVVYAHTNPDDTATYAPIFTTMLDSWRPDLSASPPVAPDILPGFVNAVENWDPSGSLSLGLIPLLLGLLVGLPLLLRGRRKPGPTNAAGLFLLIYGLRQALILYPQLLATTGVASPHIRLWTPSSAQPVFLTALPALNEVMLRMAIALVTVVMVARLALRRRRGGAGTRVTVGLLLAVNLGLLALQLLPRLFGGPKGTGGRLHVLQALTLVAAFVWDLVTSGERTARTSDNRSPRYARLLLYLGYSMVSFMLIMYVTVLNSSGNPFDTGDWTSAGIYALGVPLLLTLFLMAIMRESAAPVEDLLADEDDDRPPEHAVPVPAAVGASSAPLQSWRG